MSYVVCDPFLHLFQPHRVLLPGETTRDRSRRSIVVFIHPDNDVLIECVDGSGKYPPVTAYDDTTRRLQKSYNY